ncbi:MAG: hypothetical protein ACXVFV_02000 [Mycobacteriales bacterium]
MPVDPPLADALRKAGAVWVARGDGPARVVWHLWHADAVWLVVGGLEQELPGGGPTATVTARGCAPFAVRVEEVAPGSPEWEEVVPLLHDTRLHPPDGEQQPARWARESTVLRLTPV